MTYNEVVKRVCEAKIKSVNKFLKAIDEGEGMARPKKKLVEKVSEETKVEVSDLERLPVEALKKLDELVPDAEVVEDETEVEIETELEIEDAPKEKRLVGRHPITKEPVYI